MPPIETIQANVTLIKDMVTCLAAMVAAYVGYMGLQTWKRQLTANAERELARRVMVAAYKVRDAIRDCRLLAGEGDREIVDITRRIHEMKLEKLDAAKADLDVELLEAEAVWGSEEDYRHCVSRLQSMIQSMKAANSRYYYFFSKEVTSTEKAADYEILFAESTVRKDKFSILIDETVKEVEEFLRPKLTLKQAKKRRWWDRLRKSRS